MPQTNMRTDKLPDGTTVENGAEIVRWRTYCLDCGESYLHDSLKDAKEIKELHALEAAAGGCHGSSTGAS